MTATFPDAIGEKLRRLSQAADDSHVLADVMKGRADSLQRDIAALRERGGASAALKRLAAELDDVDGQHRDRLEAKKIATHLVSVTGRWCERQRGTFEAVEVEVKRAEGEATWRDTVARLRKRLYELRREVDILLRMPLPADELKTLVRAQLAELAKDAPVSVDRVTGEVGIAISRQSRDPNLALLAALMHAALTLACDARIDEELADAPATLPAEAKRLRMISVQSQIELTEREEERAVELALESGEIAVRRFDCRPEILLGVRKSEEAREAAA